MLTIHSLLFLSVCVPETRVPLWTDSVGRNSLEQRRVFIKPDLHSLVVIGEGGVQGNRIAPAEWRLFNDMSPTFRVAIESPRSGSGRFRYVYSVANAATAKDSIRTIQVDIPSFAPGTEAYYSTDGRKPAVPRAMVGTAETARQSELQPSKGGKNVVWAAIAGPDVSGIPPGKAGAGFYLESSLMPGFTTAAVYSSPKEPPPEADSAVIAEADSIDVGDYFYVSALTFGPMFMPGAVPEDVLANYRLGVARLSRCSGISHNAEFLEEVSQILNETGIETRLAAKLGQMRTAPRFPVEKELLDCLRIAAAAMSQRVGGGR